MSKWDRANLPQGFDETKSTSCESILNVKADEPPPSWRDKKKVKKQFGENPCT